MFCSSVVNWKEGVVNCRCVTDIYVDDNKTENMVLGIKFVKDKKQTKISPLEVSVVMMETVLRGSDTKYQLRDKWRSMLDTGATVSLIPTFCAEQLGLSIMPHTDGRRVKTADQEGTLKIQGWVDLQGYIGKVAVCSAVEFIILASCQLQGCGLGMDLQPDSSICELYAVEGSFAILEQSLATHLYYIDPRRLMNQPLCLYLTNDEGCKLDAKFCKSAISNTSEKKRKPPGSLSFRVFRFHRRFKHVPFSTLSRMLC